MSNREQADAAKGSAARPKLEHNLSKCKEPMPEQDPAIRAANFEEVALGYDEETAVREAMRCLHCPKAPCVSGCPVGVPISDFIRAIRNREFARAYALVKMKNALPAICGRVCPQESQCEGLCTRGRKGEPVGIGYLERFVADWAMDHADEASAAIEALRTEERSANEEQLLAMAIERACRIENCGACEKCIALTEPEDLTIERAPLDVDCPALDKLAGKKVACVGSGPAALTCAGMLAAEGVEVTVFEALHEIGGVLSYGIPEFRLPKSLIYREVQTIRQTGVSFEVNSVIGKLYDIRELLDEKGFDAVFVGTGAGAPTYMDIDGEDLDGVMAANELLTRVNLMKAYRFPDYVTPVYAGKKCVVVGGGNVAMDAARTAKRLGAQVTVVYRRGREEMPARDEEIAHAEEEGIEFRLLASPVSLAGDEDGWVSSMTCATMQLGQPGEDGRRRPEEVLGQRFDLECDMVVVAVGSKTNKLIQETTPGLDFTDRHLIVADEKTCITSIPGVFAGGDAVIGAATVILAMGAGKRAAKGIMDYLSE